MDPNLKARLAPVLTDYLAVRSSDPARPAERQLPFESRLCGLLYNYVVGSLKRLCGGADEDTVQEGMVAALEAARTFDPAHDADFLTWVYRNLRKRSFHVWRKQQPMPSYITELKLRAGPIEEAWQREYRREMPAELLARELNESVAVVERMRRYQSQVAPLPEDWMAEAPAVAPGSDFFIDLEAAIESLPKGRQQQIARLCLVDGHGTVEVGMLLNIHPHKVQEILGTVKQRLARRLEAYAGGE
jgi:RNA polymerase sigma factor (sigma-70 family)